MNKIKMKNLVKHVAIDLCGYALVMGVFLVIFYLVPYELEGEGEVVGNESEHITFGIDANSSEDKDENETENNEEDVSQDENGNNRDESTEAEEESTKNTENNDNTGKRGKKDKSNTSKDRGNTDTTEIDMDESEYTEVLGNKISSEEIGNYDSENLSIEITKNSYGSGDDTVTYYVADIYINSLSNLCCAFAKDTYGTNIKSDVDTMAAENDAVFAITGDSYGNNDTGIVVRNGILYRSTENEADVCVLFMDGTMKIYTAEEFDMQEISSEGVWQAWCFGPGLLEDGNILESYNSTDYLSGNHPRTAIGYVSPGHYVCVVVDGRDEGYSRGVSLSELSAIMTLCGCESAYNLDGGGSSTMYFEGEYVNNSTGRDVTDIIYFKE